MRNMRVMILVFARTTYSVDVTVLRNSFSKHNPPGLKQSHDYLVEKKFRV